MIVVDNLVVRIRLVDVVVKMVLKVRASKNFLEMVLSWWVYSRGVIMLGCGLVAGEW